MTYEGPKDKMVRVSKTTHNNLNTKQLVGERNYPFIITTENSHFNNDWTVIAAHAHLLICYSTLTLAVICTLVISDNNSAPSILYQNI